MSNISLNDPLLLPRAGQRPATSATGGLSPELLSESARRLRTLALLYAFTFFMSAFFPPLLFASERATRFDFGVADDGRFYYVMELLNGLDLEMLVRRHGPVPAERMIYLLRQMCHSLAEAELRGLVHRDIKPANLFVCRYGGEDDFLKVLDFGIAKPTLDMSETGTLALTRDNVVHGTPAYIAPEQALGAAPVDGRADIYAAGCVAYFLLTGQLVFTADTPMGLVVHHANTQPVPPSERSELSIPPALDRVVLDCLAKRPEDRPQSARELSRRLAEIGGIAQWTEDRAHAWWDAHEPGH
jgi:eukaryotic-like serine/threonine-protein kinase